MAKKGSKRSKGLPEQPDAEWTLSTLIRMLTASPSEEPLTEAETYEAVQHLLDMGIVEMFYENGEPMIRLSPKGEDIGQRALELARLVESSKRFTGDPARS